MKKTIILLLSIVLLSSCLDEVKNVSQPVILPIESYTVPTSFKFGESDTIKVKYLLPNNCFSFYSVYYQYQDTTRIVAINSIQQLDAQCSEDEIEKETEFIVNPLQREDYLFRFYKGVDDEGKNIFEDVAVPVEE